MTLNTYTIRAEFPGNSKVDFAVTAEDRKAAVLLAEERLCRARKLPFDSTTFDWHGMVVFVNHSPRF